jgi:chemotaxis protein methyltransferase CheR
VCTANPISGGEFEIPFTEVDFQTLAGIVYERSGIVLALNKRAMAYARLVRHLRTLGLRSFHDYCSLLKSSKGQREIGFLINAMTTNLTKFFREPHHFDHFRETVLPEIANAAQGTRPRIRVWSAGCSSGEEPYSVAMNALLAQNGSGQEWDFEILGTDLDTAMLQKAKSATYAPACLSNVPQDLRERFFEPLPAGADPGIPLKKEVRNLVTFRPMNLLANWPPRWNFDVIFCRNVMIYFDARTKAALLERFHAALNNGGWLYLGHSESLFDYQSRFKLCGRTIYQKINA